MKEEEENALWGTAIASTRRPFFAPSFRPVLVVVGCCVMEGIERGCGEMGHVKSLASKEAISLLMSRRI